MHQPVLTLLALAALAAPALAQSRNGDQLFRPLEEVWPTPTTTRTASGAPGAAYWQQRVDYAIEATLDETTHKLTGREDITYHNRSPDELRYLWVQLDQNIEACDAHAHLGRTTGAASAQTKLPYTDLGGELMRRTFPGGHTIHGVTDPAGAALPYTVVGTMMRVDLPVPLAPGGRFAFRITWSYVVRDISVYGSRTGFELVQGDPKNPIYTIAHWYPRLAAYSDRYGWHVHQYLGEEFALEFGQFRVRLTVPADYVVAATGELQNGAQVLTAEQQKRLAEARTAPQPVFIVTPAEAKAAQQGRASGTKTWEFLATDVRDFAWASSRKYIWDAQGTKVSDRTVMAMSVYPNEAEPLWSQYSTAAVRQCLAVYSRHAGNYPYPVAWSCNGAVGGMEHPMVSFQSQRPEKDGTYSARQKHGLIAVIIHEVGHNWFPMIINSDERRWRWMDEGFNSFVEQMAEDAWQRDFPVRNDVRKRVVLDYMAAADDQPIMTDAEVIIQGGTNAYAKTTLALTVLRESVLGRPLFDFAFGEYCRRWKFKRPMPADFFRTMEDAAGMDLDWFFRAWFYSTDHVDLGITGIRKLDLETKDPDVDKARAKARKAAEIRTPRHVRNAAEESLLESHPELKDFYNAFDEFAVTEAEREAYRKMLEALDPHERELLKTTDPIYILDFVNVGGIPMPLVLQLQYADGTQGEVRLPATIWHRSVGGRVSKLWVATKPIARIVLDPHDEMADVDRANNAFPQLIAEGTLELTKATKEKNPMQLAKEAEEQKAKEAAKPPPPPAGGK